NSDMISLVDQTRHHGRPKVARSTDDQSVHRKILVRRRRKLLWMYGCRRAVVASRRNANTTTRRSRGLSADWGFERTYFFRRRLALGAARRVPESVNQHFGNRSLMRTPTVPTYLHCFPEKDSRPGVAP